MLYGRDDRTQCRGRCAVGSDLVTVSQADRCDGTFGKQCNRRNHGATGSRVRCRENRSDRCAMRRAGYGAMRERSGHNAAKAAAGRYEERRGKAAPGTHPSLRDCGPKRKRRPHNADASPEHKLILFSSVLCNLSCNSFFSSLFCFCLLQQQQQPQPLQQP